MAINGHKELTERLAQAVERLRAVLQNAKTRLEAQDMVIKNLHENIEDLSTKLRQQERLYNELQETRGRDLKDLDAIIAKLNEQDAQSGSKDAIE